MELREWHTWIDGVSGILRSGWCPQETIYMEFLLSANAYIMDLIHLRFSLGEEHALEIVPTRQMLLSHPAQLLPRLRITSVQQQIGEHSLIPAFVSTSLSTDLANPESPKSPFECDCLTSFPIRMVSLDHLSGQRWRLVRNMSTSRKRYRGPGRDSGH